MATATVTVSSILTTTLTTTAASASATSSNSATPQGGILEHVLPNAYSASNPITLFIIQVSVVYMPWAKRNAARVQIPKAPRPRHTDGLSSGPQYRQSYSTTPNYCSPQASTYEHG